MKSNFPKSTVEKNDYGDVTYKKVFGPKWHAVIAFVLAMLADLTALVYVAVKGGGVGIIIFPILLFVFTLAMLVISVFTDYRFKYSVLPVVVYIVLSAIVIGMFALRTVANVDVTVSTAGYIFLAVSHVLTYVLSVALVFGGNGYAPKQKRSALAFTVLLTAVTAASIFGHLTFGFYGQGIGIFDEEMIVVYNYDEEKDGYEASTILAGRGSKLNLPAEFNGKPVVGVSCDLFLHYEIDEVILAEGTRASVTSTELITEAESAPEKLPTVISDVQTVNHFREQLFELSVANGANATAMALCDSFRCNFDETKTELHFEYDLENFPLGAEPGFIPVFLLDKGSVFDREDYLQYVPYFSYVDPVTNEELAKAYSEINGYCLFSPTFADSADPVDGAKLSGELYRVELAFDRVYLIDLEDGNDGLYSVPTDMTETKIGDKIYDGRLVRASALDGYVSSLPARKGFTVSFSVDNGTVADAASLGAALERKGGTADLVPTWSVVQPKLSELKFGKSTYVYGDESAVLTATATCELAVKYAFYRGNKVDEGNLLSDTVSADYTITNPVPDDSDGYTVAVYVEDPTTELTCTPVVKSCELKVNKKQIEVQWSLPENATYNTQAHAYSAAIDPADMVRDDQLDLSLTLADLDEAGMVVSECVNAGNYELSVAFENPDYDELYQLKTANRGFTVAKYAATVSWGNCSFVYNASSQQPTVTVQGVAGADLTVGLVTAAEVNAGSYTATFGFDRIIDERNYSAEKSTSYTISPKAVNAVWGNTDFTYNAQEQGAAVSSFEGLCGSDVIDPSGLTYSGRRINAGSHTVTVALPSTEKNYTVSNASCLFTISPLAVTLKPQDLEKVYDGASVAEFTVESTQPLPGADKVSEIVTRFGYGEAAGKTDVRTDGTSYYLIELSVAEQGAKYGNYTLSFESGKYTVTKRTVQVTADDKSHVYNGSVFNDFTVSPNGLASTDKLDQVVSAFGYGLAATGINVNDYEITLSIESFGDKYHNYNVVLNNGTLTITQRPLTVKADDKIKTYDTAPYSGFTVSVTGLAPTDTADQVASFKYEGSDAVNAGSHEITPAVETTAEKYGNYAITFLPGTLTVNKRDITVSANPASKVYDGTAFVGFTVTEPADLPGTDTMSQIILSYSYGAAESAVNAGTHVITLSVKEKGMKWDNYNVKLNNSALTISKRAALVSVNGVTKTYDGQTAAFEAYSGDLQGTDTLAEVATFSFGAAENAVKAGTYSITLAVKTRGVKYNNYELSFSTGAELKIEPKALTLSVENTVKTYDGKTANINILASGLVPGDTLASVGTFDLGEAGTAVNTGVYSATLTVATEGDRYSCYTITLEDGTLSIGARSLTVTATSATVVYNGKTHAIGYTVDGLAEGDELSKIVASLTFGDAATAVNVGSYPITLAIAETADKYDNYTVSLVNGTLTIAPASLTVTAKDAEKTEDGEVFADFELIAEGLVEGDELSEVVSAFTYGEAENATEAGSYSIDLEVKTQGAKYSNYEITLVDGTLTVNEATQEEGEV